MSGAGRAPVPGLPARRGLIVDCCEIMVFLLSFVVPVLLIILGARKSPHIYRKTDFSGFHRATLVCQGRLE
ncbi:hypothetical protein [Amycolatopsis thermoflava]|uniref:hypothetical protein n=1 Tax=Amycolatopsis thermoflava TaxID=84480 RepID=UPI003D733E8D